MVAAEQIKGHAQADMPAGRLLFLGLQFVDRVAQPLEVRMFAGDSLADLLDLVRAKGAVDQNRLA